MFTYTLTSDDHAELLKELVTFGTACRQEGIAIQKMELPDGWTKPVADSLDRIMAILNKNVQYKIEKEKVNATSKV